MSKKGLTMFNSEGPVGANQVPPVTQRLQQVQQAEVRLTGSSEGFCPMESIISQNKMKPA